MVENRIREFREKAGISQTELVRRAKIASPNLRKIENGRVEPWPKIRRSLARVLKVSQHELFPENQENG
jgi:transcriptional regulator with XRE-family HTH domain